MKKNSWRGKAEDWRKLLVSAEKPSIEIAKLKTAGKLSSYPELLALAGCLQDPVWHPEGDAWAHTLLCLDAFAAERLGDEYEDYVVGLAVLCHDLGKPATTRTREGRIVSRGHEAAGEAPSRSFLSRIGADREDIEAVIHLVLCHMRPEQLYDCKSGDSAVRRLARAVSGRLDRLVRVCRADKGGRGLEGIPIFPAGDWLLGKYRQLQSDPSIPQVP
ncbi:MAG: HD domain-containing protein [Elusimicrobia bacterium]|nr:HD domain-containing protein [Elusimicrobiota bacterium]